MFEHRVSLILIVAAIAVIADVITLAVEDIATLLNLTTKTVGNTHGQIALQYLIRCFLAGTCLIIAKILW